MTDPYASVATPSWLERVHELLSQQEFCGVMHRTHARAVSQRGGRARGERVSIIRFHRGRARCLTTPHLPQPQPPREQRSLLSTPRASLGESPQHQPLRGKQVQRGVAAVRKLTKWKKLC